jgi:hypothetical protein
MFLIILPSYLKRTLRKEALEQYLDGGLKEASIITQVFYKYSTSRNGVFIVI